MKMRCMDENIDVEVKTKKSEISQFVKPLFYFLVKNNFMIFQKEKAIWTFIGSLLPHLSFFF